PPRVRQGGDQRHGRPIRVADEEHRGAGAREHRLDEVRLIAKADGARQGPGRARAGAVQIGRQDAKPRRQLRHEVPPLPRGAGVRMQTDDARPRAGLSKIGLGSRAHRAADLALATTTPLTTWISTSGIPEFLAWFGRKIPARPASAYAGDEGD